MSTRVSQNLLPDGTLAPLAGAKRMPLVSLEECIESSGLDNVRSLASLPGMEDIDEAVFAAMSKAEEVVEQYGPNKYGLTVEHMAALHLYTQDILYGPLNAVLRSADRSLIKPYYSYLRLVMDAFRLLPAYQPFEGEPFAVIFRGVNKDISSAYPVGKKLFFWAFSSCTKEGKVLENKMFMGTKGPRTLLNITTKAARDISRYSAYAGEAEVLLPPGLQFQVNNKMQVPGSDGLMLIDLSETSDKLVPWLKVHGKGGASKHHAQKTAELKAETETEADLKIEKEKQKSAEAAAAALKQQEELDKLRAAEAKAEADLKMKKQREAAAAAAALKQQTELDKLRAAALKQQAELDKLRAAVLKQQEELGKLRAAETKAEADLKLEKQREAAAAAAALKQQEELDKLRAAALKQQAELDKLRAAAATNENVNANSDAIAICA